MIYLAQKRNSKILFLQGKFKLKMSRRLPIFENICPSFLYPEQAFISQELGGRTRERLPMFRSLSPFNPRVPHPSPESTMDETERRSISPLRLGVSAPVPPKKRLTSILGIPIRHSQKKRASHQ